MTDIQAVTSNVKSEQEKKADINALGNCWDGVVYGAETIRDLVYAAAERTLTVDERFELQHELENFVSFTDLTTKDLGGLFLPPAEYERRKARFRKDLSGE